MRNSTRPCLALAWPLRLRASSETRYSYDQSVFVIRSVVATVNRALVTVRRFLRHLVQSGAVSANPAEAVKELRRMPILPKGLSTSEVRKILREIELRQDHKAGACIGLMLHAGLRASEVVGLELDDVTVAPRSGQIVCRHGKGNKQRIVPLSVEARRVRQAYR